MVGAHEWRSESAYVEVTDAPLDAARIVESVSDPGAGAISTFHGVTRDSFKGRRVLHLEYEAYEPMAVRKLQDLCNTLLTTRAVTKVAMVHRTGVVAVGQASVIIAVSSPHRREAIEAVHWAIDELKATVPIWKKESFEDGSVWKENAESRTQELQQRQQQPPQPPLPP